MSERRSPGHFQERADAHEIAFARAVSAANWLQASNPSERWKWDFLYQDLPPVKGHNADGKRGRESLAFL